MNWIHAGIWLYTIAIWVFTVLFIIHCLRSRNLYRPYQQPLNLVKLFWVLCLLTFSPLVLLAYFIFALLTRPQPKRTIAFDSFASIVIVLLCILSIPWLSFPFHSLTPNQEYTRIGSEWMEENPSQTIEGGFHLGTIEANNSTSTGTSSSSTDDCLFACRRIAMIVDDYHPLNQEILEPIIEALKSLPFVEEIKTLSWTNISQLDGRLPNLFIRISSPKIEETYIPPRLKLNAQYQVHVSDQLFHGNTHYGVSSVLPRFQLHMNINLEHQSTTTFIGTPNSKYALAAKDIGKNLAETIGKTLREQAEKFSLLPQEADAFLSEPTEHTALPFPSLNEREPFLSGSRPFVSRIAFWKIDDPSEQTQAIEQLIPEIQSAGWYVHDGTDTQRKPRFWHFSKEGSWLEILEEPSPGLAFDTEIEPVTTKPLYIIYNEEINRKKVIDVLKQKDINDWPISFLLALKQTMQSDPELKERFFQRLKNEKTFSASQYLILADLWQSMNDLQQEWLNLNKALILSSIKPGSNSVENSIQERIKKFQEKHPDFHPTEGDEALFSSMGFFSMPAGTIWEVSQEMSLNQPLVVWKKNDAGELYLISTYMTGNEEESENPSFTLTLRVKDKNGSSSGSTGGIETWSMDTGYNELRYNANSRKLDDNRFQMSIRKHENSSAPAGK